MRKPRVGFVQKGVRDIKYDGERRTHQKARRGTELLVSSDLVYGGLKRGLITDKMCRGV